MMTVKQFNVLCLAICLLLLSVVSCRQSDVMEIQGSHTEASDSVRVYLSAEIGFHEDEGDLRGLGFKLEEINGKKIPRPQFDDNDVVEVHTIIKSNAVGATPVVKTLKWKYVASTKTLKILQGDPDNVLTIPNFNNDSNTKWYIAGLFAPGSTLNGTEVAVQGSRELQWIANNVGDYLGELSVPYWFGWIELKFDSTKPRGALASHQEAYAPFKSTKFSPLGSLIVFRFGNKMSHVSGFRLFRSFTVHSNVYSDKVLFELNAPIQATEPAQSLPLWHDQGNGSINYKYSGGAPGIEHNTVLDGACYAWVMPHSLPPLEPSISVYFDGASSDGASLGRYRTDYTPESKASRGIPQQGKIQVLRANVTEGIRLPIEYVTDYNIAGGEEYAIKNDNPDHGFEGPTGHLRFENENVWEVENPHTYVNNQSGYYNWYITTGTQHPDYNPNGLNLMDAIATRFGDRFFLPEFDHWRAIFPSRQIFSWHPSPEPSKHHVECIQVGYNEQKYLITADEYSGRPVNYPTGSITEADNVVVYAIRHRPVKESIRDFDYDRSSRVPGSSGRYKYLRDNSLKCAYRYTRVGDIRYWAGTETGHQEYNRVKIDVVYLGDADFKQDGKTELETISDQAWWDGPAPRRWQAGLHHRFTRIFSAPGAMTPSVGNYLHGSETEFSRAGYYWSSTRSGEYAFAANLDYWGVLTDTYQPHLGFAVRLFKKLGS